MSADLGFVLTVRSAGGAAEFFRRFSEQTGALVVPVAGVTRHASTSESMDKVVHAFNLNDCTSALLPGESPISPRLTETALPSLIPSVRDRFLSAEDNQVVGSLFATLPVEIGGAQRQVFRYLPNPGVENYSHLAYYLLDLQPDSGSLHLSLAPWLVMRTAEQFGPAPEAIGRMLDRIMNSLLGMKMGYSTSQLSLEVEYPGVGTLPRFEELLRQFRASVAGSAR